MTTSTRAASALAILTASAIALAGCGSSGASHPTFSAAHPSGTAAHSSDSSQTEAGAKLPAGGVCGLLTPKQASALEKIGYDTSKPDTSGPPTCVYHNDGTSELEDEPLSIEVTSMPGCWAYLRSIDGVHKKMIAGLGDSAYAYSLGVDVKLGSTCVAISASSMTELDGNPAPDIAVAKVVLAKLG